MPRFLHAAVLVLVLGFPVLQAQQPPAPVTPPAAPTAPTAPAGPVGPPPAPLERTAPVLSWFFVIIATMGIMVILCKPSRKS